MPEVSDLRRKTGRIIHRLLTSPRPCLFWRRYTDALCFLFVWTASLLFISPSFLFSLLCPLHFDFPKWIFNHPFFNPIFLHCSCHLDHLVAPLTYIRRASSSPLHPFLVGGPPRQPHIYPEGTRPHQVVAAVRILYGSPSTSYRRKPQEEKGR